MYDNQDQTYYIIIMITYNANSKLRSCLTICTLPIPVAIFYFLLPAQHLLIALHTNGRFHDTLHCLKLAIDGSISKLSQETVRFSADFFNRSLMENVLFLSGMATDSLLSALWPKFKLSKASFKISCRSARASSRILWLITGSVTAPGGPMLIHVQLYTQCPSGSDSPPELKALVIESISVSPCSQQIYKSLGRLRWLTVA